uniref:Apolipoprotein C-III n=1 Tax=Rattus norvegicus TaxID=10116 RepID=A0ABK0LGF3_RAT
MQPRMLLIVALVALLASARADEGEGSLLLGSMQGYMEQASKTVQDALSSMQESDIAVVARKFTPPLIHPLRARDGTPQGHCFYGLQRQADLSIHLPSGWCLRPEERLDGRGWMDNRFKSLKGYWSKFTDKFTGLWESGPEDQLTTPTLEP